MALPEKDAHLLRSPRGHQVKTGNVLCLRGSGYVFDIVSSVGEATKIIEPLARANRGEKFYAATIVMSVHEPLPPLAFELAYDGISAPSDSVRTETVFEEQTAESKAQCMKQEREWRERQLKQYP